MMPTHTRYARLAATAVALTFAAACSTTQAEQQSDVDTPAATDANSVAPQASDDSVLRLRITVDTVELTATLHDSQAGRDLVAQLPLTLSMSDHGSVEKTGPLPEPLSLHGQPDGADPIAGDLGYYAPGHDLVLYYGDQDYYDGIVRLGTLEGDLDAIAEYGEVTVQIEQSTS